MATFGVNGSLGYIECCHGNLSCCPQFHILVDLLGLIVITHPHCRCIKQLWPAFPPKDGSCVPVKLSKFKCRHILWTAFNCHWKYVIICFMNHVPWLSTASVRHYFTAGICAAVRVFLELSTRHIATAATSLVTSVDSWVTERPCTLEKCSTQPTRDGR